MHNDLSHFPVPFYDPRDNRPLTLPMIFPGSPAVAQQQAAAIIASWFGSKAGWRGQQFPVYFNELPDRNAIVFATNDKRPDFLRDHPPVNAPTIEMIDNPNDPYVKLLVIFGRDDKDLLLAAKGIAGQYSVPRQQRHRGRHQNPAAAAAIRCAKLGAHRPLGHLC